MPEAMTGERHQQQTQFFGKYRGSVVDNMDPENLGRVRVLVPQVLGTTAVWAAPCVAYAGPSLGLYLMPDIDTGVWVEFEAGDPSYPIWVGCFWARGDIDPGDAKPSVKYLRTKKFTLRIDDDIGEILIQNDSGTEIKLTAQELSHKSQAVKQEASGGRRTDLTSTSFNVNNGALEVL